MRGAGASLTLGRRFVLLVLAFLTFTIGALTVALASFEESQHERDLLERGRLLGRFVALISPEAILGHDYESLNDYMVEAAGHEDILYSAVLDADGHPMTSFLDDSNPYIAEVLGGRARSSGTVLEAIAALEGADHVVHLQFPITHEGGRLGVVAVGLCRDRLLRETRKMLAALVAVMLVAVAVPAAGITAVFLRDMLGPVRELVGGAERVAGGNYAVPVPVRRDDELGRLSGSFNHMMGMIARDVQSRTLLGDVLGLALEDLPEEDLLRRFIARVTAYSALGVQKRGAVFLTGPEGGELHLAAGHGIPEGIRRTCGRVALGVCLCGKAAERSEVVFKDRIDGEHDHSYPDMTPHGHYCVPIRSSGGKVIGVFTLFLDSGVRWDRQVEEALVSAAAILGSILTRRRAEQELATHRQRLEEIVEERTAQLREVQSELLRREKLIALGHLTATVAHELRNPLGSVALGVKAIAELLGEECSAQISRPMQIVERSVRRCDRIIEELLDFTRRRELTLRETVLDTWLAGVLDEQTFPGTVSVTRDLASGAVVLVEAEHFRRAVVNVLENALHAMTESGAGGGRLEVSTRRSEGRAEIAITDTGPGIPPEIMPKIFEPLFSTRTFGVGLGLSIVKDLTERHDGGIKVLSAPGRGTAVTIWLPALERGEEKT